MAYLSTLFSAKQTDIEAFRNNKTTQLTRSMSAKVSHLIAGDSNGTGMCRNLWEALDAGKFLTESGRKLKDSRGLTHYPDDVKRLNAEFQTNWPEFSLTIKEEDIWWREQIQMVVDLFEHAAAHDECIVVGMV